MVWTAALAWVGAGNPDVAVVAPHAAAYGAGAASPGWVTWLQARFGQCLGSARPVAASAAEVNRLAHSPGVARKAVVSWELLEVLEAGTAEGTIQAGHIPLGAVEDRLGHPRKGAHRSPEAA